MSKVNLIMYISEEIHRDLISLAKKRFVPHVPTQESILEKAINEVPGIVCFKVDVQHYHDFAASYTFFKIKIQCTQLGLINLATLHNALIPRLRCGEERPRIFTVNEEQGFDDSQPKQLAKVRTYILLAYQIKVPSKDMLFDASFEVLKTLIDIAKSTQYVHSLIIPNITLES